MNTILVLAGTKKGLFLFTSADRANWRLSGPFQAGREINHAIYDSRKGFIYATANDSWFGCEVVRSADLGKTWQTAEQNPAFSADEDLKLERIWHIEPGRPNETGGTVCWRSSGSALPQWRCWKHVVPGIKFERPSHESPLESGRRGTLPALHRA